MVLPILLQNIFGFENEPGWGLDKVSKIQDREAFVQIRHLLSPEGPLLTLVYNLQMDPYTTYEFPLKCLPVSVTSNAGKNLLCTAYDCVRMQIHVDLSFFKDICTFRTNVSQTT